MAPFLNPLVVVILVHKISSDFHVRMLLDLGEVLPLYLCEPGILSADSKRISGLSRHYHLSELLASSAFSTLFFHLNTEGILHISEWDDERGKTCNSLCIVVYDTSFAL